MISYEIRTKQDSDDDFFEWVEGVKSEKTAYRIFNERVKESPDKYFELVEVQKIIIKTHDGHFKE